VKLVFFSLMVRNFGRRFIVGTAAVFAVISGATVAGMSVAPTSAGASPPTNLIQNGSFESVAQQTTSFVRVNAGSSAISDWTVFTPSIYEGDGGSVDYTASSYFVAEDGNYSIDLAGSSRTPGGVAQSVATTPGVEYSLSFWSAVNGKEKPGIKHIMKVSVNGSALDRVKAVSVGPNLNWVQNTATFTASSTSSLIEFGDATPTDRDQGPTLDNVSLTEVPDTITPSPAAIADQTTGVSFTAPVATFTDSYPNAPTSDFAANILWGDGGTSTGMITASGSTYTVTGTHSYAASDSYTVETDISSIAGSTASTSEMVSVVDLVTGCTDSGCTGSVTTPTESVSFDSPSTTGTLETSVGPADNGPVCANDPFRHAPEVTTYNPIGMDANITFTVSFDNASADGLWYVPFEVCFQAQTPFTDYFGNAGVTTGLLPQCGSPVVAPCVQSIVESPNPQGNPAETGTVVETLVVPPTDPPKYH
jgi:choice-of-anchor C domain-containing protein